MVFLDVCLKIKTLMKLVIELSNQDTAKQVYSWSEISLENLGDEYITYGIYLSLFATYLSERLMKMQM